MYREHTVAWLNRSSGRNLVIRYEDMVNDTSSMFLKKIFPFLGLRDDCAQTRLFHAIHKAAASDTIHRKHAYEFPFTDRDRATARTRVGVELLASLGYTV